MVTSNQRGYGISLTELKRKAQQMELEINKRNEEPKTQVYDLSFLYSRCSDSIGAGIPYSDSALSKVFLQNDSLMDTVKRKSLPTALVQKQGAHKPKRHFSSEEVQEILKSYVHETKVQHSLYPTTSSDYGRKKPTPATFTSARSSRSQAFSSSFNNIMPRDSGLNTTLSRSKIHSLLDP